MTTGRRAGFIPESEGTQIIDDYFEMKKETLGQYGQESNTRLVESKNWNQKQVLIPKSPKVESLEDMTARQTKLLQSLLYGEFILQKPSFERAIEYEKFGAQVFMYYLDIIFPVDYLLQAKSPFQGKVLKSIASIVDPYEPFFIAIKPKQAPVMGMT